MADGRLHVILHFNKKSCCLWKKLPKGKGKGKRKRKHWKKKWIGTKKSYGLGQRNHKEKRDSFFAAISMVALSVKNQ